MIIKYDLVYLSNKPIATYKNSDIMNSSTSRKEVKQMPAKAKTPNELAVIVRENLKRLTANTRYPKATIADVCHVTRGTVSHWFSETKPKLPSMECLMKIADYYQIMVDTLLTESGDKYMHRRFQTYSDAFTILIDFIREGIIEPKDINNRILRELCTMYDEAINSFAIPDATISEWVKDIVARFCIEMPNKESMGDEIFYLDEVTERLYESGRGIRTMDKLQTLENLAKALSNKRIIREQIQALEDAEEEKDNPEIQEIISKLHRDDN